MDKVKLIRKFLATKNKQKIYIIIVVILSGLARMATLFLPFKLTSKFLGQYKQNHQFCVVVKPQQVMLANRMGKFVERVCDYVPWEAKCLVAALVLRFFLWRYKIPYVIYLGVAKADNKRIDTMIAHAWTSVGPQVVTGKDGHKAFTIVSTFVTPGFL